MRIDGHMTLTFDAYVEDDTLSFQGQKFKGKKAEENAILVNKSAPFSSQHQTRWKYSSSLGSTTHVIIIIIIIIIIITTIFIVLSS